MLAAELRRVADENQPIPRRSGHIHPALPLSAVGVLEGRGPNTREVRTWPSLVKGAGCVPGILGTDLWGWADLP